MKGRLRILHVEDDLGDAELVEETLVASGIGCSMQVVSTRENFTAALDKGAIDLILADLALPAFNGMTALEIVREREPDLPFIFVSGRLGEEAAIESLKSGATDYVLKNRLSRLAPAVTRAMSEAEDRAERKKVEEELEIANAEIRETAERYQNLFTSIRDVIVVADNDRTILHVNQPAMREIFGYDREDVEGKCIRILYADEAGYRLSGREIIDLSKVKGKILEVNFRRKNGEIFIGEQYLMKRLSDTGVSTGNISIFRDISERKKAEEALRESEMRRYQLQLELVYAAEVQAKLLPRSYPNIHGFEVAAQCLPAKQVGGDFFDWMEVCTGVWSFTLGDVMGKGMAAAMLMATVRASLRSVAHNRPEEALRLAEQALSSDLDNSESFVTLFHAQLYGEARRLTFVDCGHGYAFLRRHNMAVEELSPRGLPLGIPGPKLYQEGMVELGKGDVLVIFSDGLIDARPELGLTTSILADHLNGAASANEMVGRLIALTEQEGPQPDDITVLVLYCTE